MHKISDALLTFILLSGLVAYYSKAFAGIKKKQLPYIVIAYLIAAPYRGVMAKYTPYTDLLIDLLLLVYFLFYMCFRKKIRICTNHLVWIFFFISAALLYSINNIGIGSFVRIQEVKFHLGITLLMIVITSTIQDKTGIQQIIDIFKVNSILIAVLDIFSYILFRQLVFSEFLSNRNFISIYELLGLIDMLYAYNKTRRKGLVVYMGIVALDLFMMKSSSVFLGILVTTVICFFKKMKLTSNRIYRIITAAMIMAVISTIFMVATPKAFENKYVRWVQNFRSSEDYTRTLIWEEAIELAKDNLLYGIGPDNFRDTKTSYKFPTHNDYLKVLTETGLLGMTGFLVFIFLSIRDIMKIHDKDMKQYSFSAILSLLIFILFHGYINYVVFWSVFCIPYWWKHIERKKVVFSLKNFKEVNYEV